MTNETNYHHLIINTLKFFRNKHPQGINDSELHALTYKAIQKKEFLTNEEMEGISDNIWQRIQDQH